MRAARMALFLQLCLAAAVAAQTPEQEMEAEARRLLPTFFTKCGDDYFSKQTFRGNPDAYMEGYYPVYCLRHT